MKLSPREVVSVMVVAREQVGTVSLTKDVSLDSMAGSWGAQLWCILLQFKNIGVWGIPSLESRCIGAWFYFTMYGVWSLKFWRFHYAINIV